MDVELACGSQPQRCDFCRREGNGGEGALCAIGKAAELIDLNTATGEAIRASAPRMSSFHPRPERDSGRVRCYCRAWVTRPRAVLGIFPFISMSGLPTRPTEPP